VSIIPRRYPKGIVAASKCDQKGNNSLEGSTMDGSSDSDSDLSESNSVTKLMEVPKISSPSKDLMPECEDPRRQRLLGKLSKLKKDREMCTSKAPSFLGFNSK